MAYAVSPSVPLNRAPTANDDESKGFLVGSSAVDSTVSPPVLYICADNAVGAAYVVLSAGFLAALAADRAAGLPAWYLRMRVPLTTLVVGSHAMATVLA